MRPQYVLIYICIILAYLFIAVSCRGGFNRTQEAPAAPSLDEQANALATQAAIAATAAAEVSTGTRVPYVPIPDDGPAAAMATVQAQDSSPSNPSISDQLADEALDLVADLEIALRSIELPDLAPIIADQLTAVTPTGDSSYSITTTEADMTQAILTAQATITNNGGQPTLQNPSVQFTNGTMVLTGTISEPNVGNVSMTMQPVVENGRLQFNITSASVGTTNIPVFVLNGAAATLNGTLGSLTNNLPAGYTIQGVAISDGFMQVYIVKI